MFEVTKKFKFESIKNGVCPVCDKKVKSTMIHLAKKTDEIHIDYLKSLKLGLGGMIMNKFSEGKYVVDIIEELKNEIDNISILFRTDVSLNNLIREIYKQNGVSSRDNVSKRMKGDNNPVNDDSVKKKISLSVRKLWDEGVYDNRDNNMGSFTMENHHSYKESDHYIENFGIKKYNVLYHYLSGDDSCVECSDVIRTRNVYHVDENRNNFLPSNLENLCVPCHMSKHYSRQKEPYCAISKDFYIPAAHFLPDHPKRCQYIHGHEWKLTIYIKKRINKKTGMVMDFSDLKKIVNEFVIDELDHNYFNNFLRNPTAENIIFWIWDQLMYNGLKGIDKIELWEAKDSLCSIDKKDMLGYFIKSFSNKLFFDNDGILVLKDVHNKEVE
jgi:6-pyruvoyltetrahydropterin/6-carboxytetrahydropterin synthase